MTKNMSSDDELESLIKPLQDMMGDIMAHKIEINTDVTRYFTSEARLLDRVDAEIVGKSQDELLKLFAEDDEFADLLLMVLKVDSMRENIATRCDVDLLEQCLNEYLTLDELLLN